MKNILEEYYQIYIENYKKQTSGITFFIDGIEYYLCQTKHSLDYIKYIYDISQNYKVGLHNFVFNKNGELLSENYVLFRLNSFVSLITYEDVKKFSIPVQSTSYISMEQFWEKKLDYLEQQIQELSKNILIHNSFAYFEGVSEAILSILRNNNYNGDLFLSHKVFSLSSLEFYNPLNLTFDLYLRDIASFIRQTKEEDKLYSVLEQNLSSYEKSYFFARLTFPFSYYEEVENIILEGKDEQKLLNHINHISDYEQYLIYMQTILGIKAFTWLK